MLQIVTSKQQTNSFRRQFEALLEPDGALFVGNPRTVSDKFLLANETLGGVETASLQMSVASLPHATRMYATELLGTKVAPVVRNHLVSDSDNDLTNFKLEAAVVEESNIQSNSPGG